MSYPSVVSAREAASDSSLPCREIDAQCFASMDSPLDMVVIDI
jgi:hypothetical protein